MDMHCLFENGAIWNQSLPIDKDPGKGEDPPTGIELVKRQFAYHRHLLKIEEDEFKQMMRVCQNQNEYSKFGVGAPVTPDMLEHLKGLQQKVFDRRQRIVPLEAEFAKYLENDEHHQRQVARREEQGKRYLQAEEISRELKRIGI
jgi:hypothetical protein